MKKLYQTKFFVVFFAYIVVLALASRAFAASCMAPVGFCATSASCTSLNGAVIGGYSCAATASGQAQVCCKMVSPPTLPGYLPIWSVGDFLKTIANMLFPAAIAVGMFLIVRAGYTIMTSEGDPQKVNDGKNALTSAVIGTGVVMLAVPILRILINAILGGNAGF